MKYRIVYRKGAFKFLEKQPKEQQKRLIEAIHKLPETGDIKPLTNSNGMYRLRVGTYRVIYTVEHDELIVYVVEIGNRGDIYK